MNTTTKIRRRTNTAARTAIKALYYRAISGTIGRWIHVHVYGPIDEALYAGLNSYKGTRHLLASTYTEAA